MLIGPLLAYKQFCSFWWIKVVCWRSLTYSSKKYLTSCQEESMTNHNQCRDSAIRMFNYNHLAILLSKISFPLLLWRPRSSDNSFQDNSSQLISWQFTTSFQKIKELTLALKPKPLLSILRNMLSSRNLSLSKPEFQIH